MIIVRTPHRISFAGGGTDFPDFYQQNGFGAVCSMSINRYVYLTVNNLADYFPHRFRIAYSKTELSQDVASIQHPIVREVLKMMKFEKGGIDINTMSDIPAGTGMGSSSAFTVSLLHALHSARNRLVSKEELAREACRLEIEIIKEPCGKQDQFAAAFGGINLIRFHSDGRANVEPIPMGEGNERELLSNMMLFYLGGNRTGAQILKDQTSNTEKNTSALSEMREQALEVAQILAGPPPYDRLGDVLKRGWMLKKSLAKNISNADVDGPMDAALKAGALGGKLLGAGGTGFLLFYVNKDKQQAVRNALQPLREIQFQVDHMGSTLLYFGG